VQPGYKTFLVQPRPDARLKFVNAVYETNYGTIASRWEIKNAQFVVDISIPANTSATVILPGVKKENVRESMGDLSRVSHNIQQQKNAVAIQLGSGEYHFNYPSGFLLSDTSGAK
jgi:alpha-L-rhamnosidase